MVKKILEALLALPVAIVDYFRTGGNNWPDEK